MSQDLFAGGWLEKLEGLATALRAVHKALIDSTRRDYELRHGKIQGPYALLALVAQDPAFAWLQPMTRVIVEIEDRLGPKAPPVLLVDFRWAQQTVRVLFDPAGEGFAAAYRAKIHSDPAVAVEHGRLQVYLRES